jgi:phosphoserine phosphatase
MNNHNSKFDSVVFDIDSTLTTIEGLDFLAKIKGKQVDVVKITKEAMDGTMSMREAMERKMSTISPSYNDLLRMGNEYIKNVTPGAKKSIEILRKNHLNVWILTGNFQPAVGMLARFLNIDSTRVITNQIFFDKENHYLGFDSKNPLSNNGGKSYIIKKYKKQMNRTVLIGDGSTDLEAKGDVDLFIGFGGVVYRPKIEEKSDVYIKKNNLLEIIPYLILG